MTDDGTSLTSLKLSVDQLTERFEATEKPFSWGVAVSVGYPDKKFQ